MKTRKEALDANRVDYRRKKERGRDAGDAEDVAVAAGASDECWKSGT
jgi:hypothetical protein